MLTPLGSEQTTSLLVVLICRETPCPTSGASVGTQWETCGKTQGYTLNPKARPQKKVLSLVLCVAMLLSVMVMGTGAAFTDQDEIQNAEAVDMTSALGIIDGYEDGSFQPAENIERGEAAKMISAMLNGGRELRPGDHRVFL